MFAGLTISTWLFPKLDVVGSNPIARFILKVFKTKDLRLVAFLRNHLRLGDLRQFSAPSGSIWL